jgi:hypothetical protein
MRASLGYDGTARELLSDLASDGGAALFIDGLDFFDRDDERRTVVDLVRAAADVPGFSVVVTARLGFGIEEPSWLPTNALDRLGRAPPVVIGELSATELDQLRDADPRLAALLADDHPARNVARNLFRLARLASLPVGDPVPCTEADMAELWWKSADGKYDSGHRDRARLLKALAEQALLAGEPMDASYHPSQALDALVTSETLRDLGGDRVAFRHDVLREWAIASLLFAEPIRVDRLPLDRPAPASLDRAIELAARMALERSSDSTPWKSLLHTLSQDGAHGSWRRAALLALVRSELGSEVLERVSDLLIADRGGLLRELIRTIMAVDVKPATELFAAAGIDVAFVPPSLHIPNKPSWPRLIEWALARHDQLPAKAIPDLVDFYIAWSYIAWSVAGMGLDPITPVLVTRLYTWLIEIEATGTLKTQEDQRKPFDSGLEYDGLRDLETNLRMGFLLFCHRVPQLAKKYLVHLRQSPKKRGVVGKFVKFSSDSLARAAPAELAELTVAALTPKIRSDRRCGDNQRCEPFEHLDREFLPASLAQGPFFNLLVHAPEHGLPLVRRLVDHAIEFYSDGSAPGSNAILIVFAQGERCFPWVQSYRWPRETAGLYSVTSALMALEAWAHRRVEAGDAFDTVLQDVLGPPGAPAAYLLIAVDLILSHWPRSREAALPFLGCPELLSLDRDRQMDDDFKVPDLFGLGLVEPKEPAGAASLEGLKKRPSRRFSLEQLMSHYAVFGPAEQREALTESLRRAAARLGNYDETATLADPAFMVVHALNLVNPVNWQEGRFEAEDGSTKIGRQYVSPSTESQHLAALQAESNPRLAETNLHAALGIALENEARSSPELAAAGVAWAQSPPVDGSEDAIWAREHSLVIAATLAMRDGDAELRATKEGWARGIFAEALRSEEDPVHRFRSGLKFNPIAIASVGMIHLLRDHAQPNDVRALLELAARQDPAMAHGFGASAATLAAIDERLPRAVLRCAFAARIQLWLDRETPEEQAAARTDDHRRRIQRTVEAELVWLSGEAPEPELPAFPVEPPCPRRRSFLTPAGIVESPQPTWDRTQPEHRVDHQGAALWLSKLAPLVDVSARPWIRDLVRTYGAWTARANGAGVNEDEEIGRVPDEWNNAYYNLLAYCLPGLSSEAIEKMAVEPICSLPEEAFFDVVSVFLRSVDAVFFENRGLETAEAVWIRSALGRRLIASNGWYRVGDYKSSSVERHIGPAIATFFMNDYAYFQPPRCYLLPKAVDRLDPFLVVLTELVESGRSLFIALVVLNLMEVSPRPGHLGFVVTAAKDWLTAYPDDTTFWVEHGIGRRVCAWIDVIREGHPATLDFTHGLRIDVDQLLATFVRLGVPEARRLEESLATEA